MNAPAPAELRAQVVAATLAGESAGAIAERLGVTTRSVHRHRQAAGISQPPPVPLTPEELDLARRLLEDGACYNEVARTLGRSWKALHRKLPGYTWPPGEGARLARLLEYFDPTRDLTGGLR